MNKCDIEELRKNVLEELTKVAEEGYWGPLENKKNTFVFGNWRVECPLDEYWWRQVVVVYYDDVKMHEERMYVTKTTKKRVKWFFGLFSYEDVDWEYVYSDLALIYNQIKDGVTCSAMQKALGMETAK